MPDFHYTKILEIDEHALQHISFDTRIELLKIIQEAVVNIIKHAKAKTISMLLYEEQEQIILDIKDDRKGFDTQKIETEKSLGIRSMFKRIEKISGTIRIHSDQNGTELIVGIPFNSIRFK